jgi:hypothetical protein
MGKTWVLDTETKGTGAHMAPLEKRPARGGGERGLSLVDLGGPPAREPAESEPEPLRFKVVDVMSAQVLAEAVDARVAVGVLEDLRSVLDARIYVWSPERGRWRLLGLDESKMLWRFRGRRAPHPSS